MRATTVSASNNVHHVVRMRCPHCRHQGTFNAVGQDFNNAKGGEGQRWFVIRHCPNDECGGVIFAVLGPGGSSVATSFPPELIDFDATALPEPVLRSLEEAITCHAAGAHRAAALMVRRTLEDLCADRGVSGPNLKARLAALRDTIVVPEDLLRGLDDLRLLGNDAAHVELQDYDDVGSEESELAVEIAKELLKAVYQYRGLVDRLSARRRAADPRP